MYPDRGSGEGGSEGLNRLYPMGLGLSGPGSERPTLGIHFSAVSTETVLKLGKHMACSEVWDHLGAFVIHRSPSPLAVTTLAICSAPDNLCSLSQDLPVSMPSGS